MRKRLIFSSILLTVLSACTTAGAPVPGEHGRMEKCLQQEMKVCTGVKGTRIQTEGIVHCTCT